MNPPLRLLTVFPPPHTPRWMVALPEHEAWAAAGPLDRCGWMILLPDWGGCIRVTHASIRRGQTFRGQPLPARVRALIYRLADYAEQENLPDRLCLVLCADSPAGPRQDYAYQQALKALVTDILKSDAQGQDDNEVSP